MAKPTKQCIAELRKIIERLERWQARHAGRVDVSEVRSPKHKLIEVLAELERLQ